MSSLPWRRGPAVELGNVGDLVANTTSIVGIAIVVGYIGKQLIEWFRGNKTVENQWRTAAITDALAGHNVLKDNFDMLRERVSDLEVDLKEAKRREKEITENYRVEIDQLKRNYQLKIQELQEEIDSLRRQLGQGNE